MSKSVKHVFINIPELLDRKLIDNYFLYLQKEISFTYEYLLSEFKPENLDGTKNQRIVLDTLYIGCSTASPAVLPRIFELLLYLKKYFYFDDRTELSLELANRDYQDEEIKNILASKVNRLVFRELTEQVKTARKLAYSNQAYISSEKSELEQQDHAKLYPKRNLQLLQANVLAFSSVNNKRPLTNISYDFFYNYPGENLLDLQRDLEALTASAVQHIYISDVQADFKAKAWEEFADASLDYMTANPDQERAMFWQIRNFLKQKNFQHYELWAWARTEKYYSRANLTYWNLANYLGFGAGAAAKLAAWRFANYQDVSLYCNRISNLSTYSLKDMAQNLEILEKTDLEERKKEFLAFSLYKRAGIDPAKYHEIFAADISPELMSKIKNLEARGILEAEAGKWHFSLYGLDYIDTALMELLF